MFQRSINLFYKENGIYFEGLPVPTIYIIFENSAKSLTVSRKATSNVSAGMSCFSWDVMFQMRCLLL